ncbi:uncharacterized protein LOC114355301 isoform X2 [Ostrinia furnacalis]|uniref:uncharacterized protein LOC114355301 isoform X2 n=1 Tax=Ostrinia furnacalis TaxID=93504 RepID=UPI00103E0B08|nr:uncharacterized protein LOC114355301 isoform X2 [Ostrinia furnacalis]
MHPTPKPGAWASWAGWVLPPEPARRRGLEEARAVWRVPPPHQIALYSPDQIRQLIRMEHAAIGLSAWPGTVPPGAWRERRPDLDRWRLRDFLQNVRLERPIAEIPVGSAGSAHAAAAGAVAARGAWEGAARGWAAGAVMLAVLVLIVRALEKCLYKRLFKDRHGSDIGTVPRLDDVDSLPSDSRESSGNDLPPPYSECANSEGGSVDADKPIGTEEPPPPYSACYFSNPKDSAPSVHFYRRRGAEAGQSSSNAQAPNISNARTDDSDKISDVGCEVNDSIESNISRGEHHYVNERSRPNIGRSRRRREEHSNHVVEIHGNDSRERIIVA